MVMLIPTAQLLIVTDLNVQAQFQFMTMAVLQPLKVKLRVVNCWLPRKAPMFPPLKTRSDMKPPEPEAEDH